MSKLYDYDVMTTLPPEAEYQWNQPWDVMGYWLHPSKNIPLPQIGNPPPSPKIFTLPPPTPQASNFLLSPPTGKCEANAQASHPT